MIKGTIFTSVNHVIDHDRKHISFKLHIFNFSPASRRKGRTEREGLFQYGIYLAFPSLHTFVKKKKKTSRCSDCEIMYIKKPLSFRSLSSGDCIGHTQGIILDKQQNVASQNLTVRYVPKLHQGVKYTDHTLLEEL